MAQVEINDRFLALEGCDGAGKTTLRHKLSSSLLRAGVELVEIGQHSWIDPIASRIILDVREQRARYSSKTIEEAYRWDKKLHELKNIRPKIEEGFVLADRTILSDAVYQEALYGIDATRSLERYVLDGYLFPGLVIYVFVDIPTALARIQSRGKHRRHYEREADLTKISKVYQKVLPTYQVLTGGKVLYFENKSGEMDQRFDQLIEPILGDAVSREINRSKAQHEIN